MSESRYREKQFRDDRSRPARAAEAAWVEAMRLVREEQDAALAEYRRTGIPVYSAKNSRLVEAAAAAEKRWDAILKAEREGRRAAARQAAQMETDVRPLKEAAEKAAGVAAAAERRFMDADAAGESAETIDKLWREALAAAKAQAQAEALWNAAEAAALRDDGGKN